MKFLSIAKMKDIAMTLPPALQRQFLESTLASMNQQNKEGKILEMYYVPGWGKSMVISEANSAEEMAQNIGGMVSSYMDIETYPLADFNKSLNIFIEAIKMAEKMMPGGPK
jgi:muconolactone delta-isomerase